jgi:hypothetical protein
MIGWAERPAITVFAGRFGSGKTETAINYVLSLVRSQDSHVANWRVAVPQVGGLSSSAPNGVILVDLDIVTPYFRSREVADEMGEKGVEVIAPSIVGQHLDTPAITPEILGAIRQPRRPVVIDVGGDRQGARALGQFSAALQERGYTMHFVVNPFRPFVNTLEGLTNSISEIEASARLQVSSLVSNPNLIGETSPRQIIGGHAKIEHFAESLGYSVAFVCVERRWVEALDVERFSQPVLILDRHFTLSWE